MPLQGRLECVAWFLLEYLHTAGVVVRAKEHPFATSAEDLGWEVRPDLLAQTTKGDLAVIEVKTARFINRVVDQQLRDNADAFRRFGVRYLVWSDASPLGHALRHNILQMRRSAAENIEADEIDRLAELVRARVELRIEDALAEGIDFGCVLAAAWRGKIHLPLKSPVCGRSNLKASPHECLERLFGTTLASSDDWWRGLLPDRAEAVGGQT